MTQRPHGWVTPGSGQLFALSAFFCNWFSTVHVRDQERDNFFIQSVSQQTLECLLCTRHCTWCWGYYSEKIDRPCRRRHSRKGNRSAEVGVTKWWEQVEGQWGRQHGGMTLCRHQPMKGSRGGFPPQPSLSSGVQLGPGAPLPRTPQHHCA